jgi:hypothetical protein
MPNAIEEKRFAWVQMPGVLWILEGSGRKEREKNHVGRQPPRLPARGFGKASSSVDVDVDDDDDDVVVEVQEEVQEVDEDVDEGG